VANVSQLKRISETLPKGVNLLAVSKGHPSSSIRSFVREGHLDFGESKLQEALSKIKDLSDINSINWHFVGHLQANKVRGVVKNFNVIHSVDSLKLAQRISRIAIEEDKKPEIMIQVKLREDPNKAGFCPKELLDEWDSLIQLPNIDLIGLMTIAPIQLDINERKILFQDCRELADELLLKDCSMGMSGDWEEAVQAGSTWLRLGSLLFGARSK